jgi:prevent-host-death family protein
MNQVRIADLKARLSEYLRAVRRGESIVVLDRETPVARLVPYESEAQSLRVRRPPPGSRPADVPMPPPLDLGFDVVDLLLEERQNHR